MLSNGHYCSKNYSSCNPWFKLVFIIQKCDLAYHSFIVEVVLIMSAAFEVIKLYYFPWYWDVWSLNQTFLSHGFKIFQGCFCHSDVVLKRTRTELMTILKSISVYTHNELSLLLSALHISNIDLNDRSCRHRPKDSKFFFQILID